MTGRDEQREGEKNAKRSLDQQTQAAGPIPFDEQGDPMVEISFNATELIGLPNYSNIVVGPATIRTLVSRNVRNPFSDVHLVNIASALNQLAQMVEENVVAEQREIALNTLDPSKVHN